jgi:ABC-type dipeptide/oligopeptide/nickel transport system permease subunit
MSEPKAQSPNQRAWRRFKRNRPAMISAWFLAVLIVIVVAWPILIAVAGHAGASGFANHHDPDTLSNAQFQQPSAAYWFGTDVHGRDLFSRVLYGAQISLLVGAVGALVSLFIGVLWGAIAGYIGGKLDDAMMRTVDIIYSLPSIIFVVVLLTSLEPMIKHWLNGFDARTLMKLTRFFLLCLGLGAVSWLNMSRIVRGQVLSLRHRAFVEASRTLGGTTPHILFRHILPNVLGVVIVYVTLTVPAVMLYESVLSFLGLGIEPPMASWGTLLSEGAQQINIVRIYWWLLAFPGAVLISTLLALSFLGDGLRDAWDVRGN